MNYTKSVWKFIIGEAINLLFISKNGNVDEEKIYGYKEFKIVCFFTGNGVSQLFIKLTNSWDYGFIWFLDINYFNILKNYEVVVIISYNL